MSDDNLFEVFEGDDIFEEDDGEIRGDAEGEGSNKTFMIAVGVLGGLLVLAIGFFIVWALFLNKPDTPATTDASGALDPTAEVIEEVVDLDATATAEAEAAAAAAEEEATEEPEPTATPTPVVGSTSTPDPDDAEGEEDDTAAAGATEEPRRSPTPTSTPRPTNTPRPTSTSVAEVDDRDTSSGVSGESEELAATGLGEVMLVVAGVLMIGVAFLARRLRSA